MMPTEGTSPGNATVLPFDRNRRAIRLPGVLRNVQAAAAALTAPSTPAQRAAGLNEQLATNAGTFLITGGRDRLAVTSLRAEHADTLAAIGPAYKADPDLVAAAVLAHVGAILEAHDVIGPFPDTNAVVKGLEQRLEATLTPDASRTSLS